MDNKVVTRYRDGRVIKGVTKDFFPNKEAFHLFPIGAQPDTGPLTIAVKELKAIFFVKDFTGDPAYQDKKAFESNTPGAGRKIKVVFKDGETIVGITQGYQPNRPGFFIVPADPKSNIERCFVVSSATQGVSLL